MRISTTSTKMKYYLDSNICIFYLRGRNIDLRDKIDSFDKKLIKIPAIVKGELLTGAMKSDRRDRNINEVLAFLGQFEIVPFDDASAWTYGEIKSALELKGQPIGYNDTIIAATVLAHDGILITNNTREFMRVEGLECEDWTQE